VDRELLRTNASEFPAKLAGVRLDQPWKFEGPTLQLLLLFLITTTSLSPLFHPTTNPPFLFLPSSPLPLPPSPLPSIPE
jgi:hypothetical protein